MYSPAAQEARQAGRLTGRQVRLATGLWPDELGVHQSRKHSWSTLLFGQRIRRSVDLFDPRAIWRAYKEHLASCAPGSDCRCLPTARGKPSLAARRLVRQIMRARAIGRQSALRLDPANTLRDSCPDCGAEMAERYLTLHRHLEHEQSEAS